MKTLLKFLTVATIMAAGVTVVAPAAHAYEVVTTRTVVHEGPGRWHGGPGYWHRGVWYRGHFDGGHCVRRVWFGPYGHRHVATRCW